MKHTNISTEIMFSKIKNDVFKKIFKLLDKDEDKNISVFNLDVKNIPSNVTAILEPIISKIKIEKISLGEDVFIDYCEQLFDVDNIYLN